MIKNKEKQELKKDVVNSCILDIEFSTKQFKSNKINYKEFCLILQNSLNLIKYYNEV